ncbi:MAG: D-alanyl-D-alanine carboxypeptidase family protein [Oscillospiraceae bacterium]|jgi:D-alanyl-D-alanine carboxypeptidase (penicillin-binding protein 5/6)
MKRIIATLICLFLTAAFLPRPNAVAAPDNSASSVILFHPDSETVLFEQNADARSLIASTTKIMTSLLILEHCNLDEKVTVEPEHTLVEGSSMYLKPEGDYTVKDLLYGLMLASGNDAALALACHVAGSVEGFARLMNQKAEELGLQNSSFENPHGLDGDNHYSSARDLAIITAAAMENETFCRIVSTPSYTVGDITYYNNNKLLRDYEGCIGVKTGYTMKAGRSLVSAAERNGMRLICVTLNDPDDWRDHMVLYDWAFSEYTYMNALPYCEFARLPVISGLEDSVGVAPWQVPCILVKNDSDITLSVELPRFVYAEVREGEKAGGVTVNVDGKPAAIVDLRFMDSVEKDEAIRLTPWERFKRAWYMANKYGYAYYGHF